MTAPHREIRPCSGPRPPSLGKIDTNLRFGQPPRQEPDPHEVLQTVEYTEMRQVFKALTTFCGPGEPLQRMIQ
ncbi:hypothetical protein, partial [Geomonas sp.]|uniref:hypothetical protein n=1 Tax=Geomonas sp. TaxID=2651584 RepID=UPI002B463454